jgi:hypothetical protein
MHMLTITLCCAALRLEPPQAQAIRAAADVPRQVLSGRHDPIAGRRYARRLAAYLDCKLHITGAQWQCNFDGSVSHRKPQRQIAGRLAASWKVPCC